MFDCLFSEGGCEHTKMGRKTKEMTASALKNWQFKIAVETKERDG